MRKNSSIDVSALIFAIVFTIAMGVVVAMWYDIRPINIMKMGFFGPPLCFLECAHLFPASRFIGVYGFCDCGKFTEHNTPQLQIGFLGDRKRPATDSQELCVKLYF